MRSSRKPLLVCHATKGYPRDVVFWGQDCTSVREYDRTANPRNLGTRMSPSGRQRHGLHCAWQRLMDSIARGSASWTPLRAAVPVLGVQNIRGAMADARRQSLCAHSKDWHCRVRVTPVGSFWRAYVACYACGSASPFCACCCSSSQEPYIRHPDCKCT